MKLNYEMPLVDIVDFLTLEKLANTRAQIEARDNGARGGEGGETGNLSADTGWEEW